MNERLLLNLFENSYHGEGSSALRISGFFFNPGQPDYLNI